ncbi:glycosyl hydrolase family 9 [Bacteroidaceae bacterium HV4-6-C5C]|nr:glycosyl hydrolase family 9 [Bacteroidaceae bacterium HV4-6-C5C]
MQKTIFILGLLLAAISSAYSQNVFTQDRKLEEQLYATGLIHAPLHLNTTNSLEEKGKKKIIIATLPLYQLNGERAWEHSGEGYMSFSKEKSASKGLFLRLSIPNNTGRRAKGSPSDPDYATYGNSTVTYHIKGKNLMGYNRLAFSIYPDCEGARVVNMNINFNNDNSITQKGYNSPTGAHLVNLINKQWNQCYLEITEYQRNKVMDISFNVSIKGKDRTTGDSAIYYINDIQFQQIKDPEKVSGWIPDENRIIYSTTGYVTNAPKEAIINASLYKRHTIFQLINTVDQTVALEGKIEDKKTTIGEFGVIDFTSFNHAGDYSLKVGEVVTPSFQIGQKIWDNSLWKALNFIFCQRCGYPVPNIHSSCHLDLFSKHEGKTISYAGGWHDAGDLSQQTLQTGDVTYALLEAYNRLKSRNTPLAARILEEAEWGIDFILKNRYGDGYRASSMGLLIWQDGIINTLDDIYSVRVQNIAYDNFLYSVYEAYASMSMDRDPMLREHLLKVAEEDFAFAMDKFKKDGFDQFQQMYEHNYSTSKSQYMATISWAASMLYKLTKKAYYANLAVENIHYTLDCQQIEPLENQSNIRGFFYRDKSQKSIVHSIHQSREQIYMQAMTLLCETQKGHPDYLRWESSIKMYGEYLKGIMQYTQPYGMIPSGIYRIDENEDSIEFHKLHLLAPDNAGELYKTQLEKGIKLNDKYYIKRFPVWFSIFNGNMAVHLSTGKSAALCGKFLNDKELLDIGMEQLYWVVGKNPFGQSLIYGEGYDYPQMNSFSSGEMVGEMPVGIRTIGNEDVPYWPQTNNACYKEVWVTSAGKWLSLVSEFE